MNRGARRFFMQSSFRGMRTFADWKQQSNLHKEPPNRIERIRDALGVAGFIVGSTTTVYYGGFENDGFGAFLFGSLAGCFGLAVGAGFPYTLIAAPAICVWYRNRLRALRERRDDK